MNVFWKPYAIILALASFGSPLKVAAAAGAAPADEYFGAQKMSALGIRMRVDALGRKYHARTIADGDLLHDATIAEASLMAWNTRYPHDPWLGPTSLHLEQLYAVIQTPEARAHATSLLRFMAATFGAAKYGHLARLRLGQGFPPLQSESAVVSPSPTGAPAASAAPSDAPAPPAASAMPAPAAARTTGP